MTWKSKNTDGDDYRASWEFFVRFDSKQVQSVLITAQNEVEAKWSSLTEDDMILIYKEYFR